MHRRHFLHRLGAAALAAPVIAPVAARLPRPVVGLPGEAATLLPLLIHENDRRLADLLARQHDAPGDRHHGGVPNAHGLYHAGSAAGLLQNAASAYIEPTSVYHRSAALVEAMARAAGFLRRTQHADGTIDLLSTNFHSTPDTGFVVEPLCLAYTLLDRNGDAAHADLRSDMQAFLLKAGEALSVGGIHTPNHRWVVSMALARLHALFPNARYLGRIDAWLAEGIDIDPDGQYTEKSTHVYTPLTNRCLITIVRLTDRPALFEPVRRNLEMTLYYVHPNGEIATEASGRQDQYQTGTLVNYLYPYRYMALHDRDGRFAALSRRIPALHPASRLVRTLAYFQEDPFLAGDLPDDAPLPDDYVRAFPHSDLVRIRRGRMDATLLADNPTVLTFSRGEAVLQGLRVASAFFGKGQFRGAEIERQGDRFILHQTLEGPYYQPYPVDELPGDGDWHKMPRARRPQSEVQRLTSRVEIEEADGALVVRFDLRGTDHVPVAVELGFRRGGTLSGVRTVDGVPDAYLLDADAGVYTHGADRIRFGPGRAEHAWTQLRGALPKLDADCVYLTGYTPFTHELRIG